MCKFLGFVTTYKDGELKVYATDLVHHTACEQVHGLKPNSYDPWEWTAEGDQHLQLKVGASDTKQTEVVRQEILRLWPTREELIMYFLRRKIVGGVWQGDFILPSDIGAAAAKYIAANVTKISGCADLQGYAHALPLLAHIGGYAYMGGYAHALPRLAHIGRSVDLRGYAHALPVLAHIGGSAALEGYGHALPLLAHIGGSADLRWYTHALPRLAHIGGYADLRGYDHALPVLAYIGWYAYLEGYAHALPLLAHIGGYADLEGYAHELPMGCEVQGRICK